MVQARALSNVLDEKIKTMDTLLDILNEDFEKMCQIENPSSSDIGNIDKVIQRLKEAYVFFRSVGKKGIILKIKKLSEVKDENKNSQN